MKFYLCFAVFSAVCVLSNANSTGFLVFGDWGMGNDQQTAVAKQMELTASTQKMQFVVNVGDNFYKTTKDSKGNAEGGVDNLTDPLWQSYFENIYNSATLKNMTFYTILGNHDYMGNSSAQLLYHGLDSRWVLPDRNYTVRFTLEDGKTTALFVFIDTSPFIASYYTKPENPTMAEQLAHQDYKKQLVWLNETLAENKDPWKFVVGHHPILSSAGIFLPGGVTQSMALVQPLLEDHNVAAYFCGHVHKLQHHQQHGIDYFISGAGATGKVYEQDPAAMASVAWQSDDAGFMAVKLDGDQMVSTFINTKGEAIYSATTKRPAASN